MEKRNEFQKNNLKNRTPYYFDAIMEVDDDNNVDRIYQTKNHTKNHTKYFSLKNFLQKN